LAFIWRRPILCYKFTTNSLIVDSNERHHIVVQIGFAERPSLRQLELLKFVLDLKELIRNMREPRRNGALTVFNNTSLARYIYLK
jgi:hypothetical protein